MSGPDARHLARGGAPAPAADPGHGAARLRDHEHRAERTARSRPARPGDRLRRDVRRRARHPGAVRPSRRPAHAAGGGGDGRHRPHHAQPPSAGPGRDERARRRARHGRDPAALVRGRAGGDAGDRDRPARRRRPAPLQVHVGGHRHLPARRHPGGRATRSTARGCGSTSGRSASSPASSSRSCSSSSSPATWRRRGPCSPARGCGSGSSRSRPCRTSCRCSRCSRR